MTKGTIKEYYDQGKTMDAIVEIFERMNQKGNLNLLGEIFKDLGSDGARLVNVMATMADRADILRKHLQTSRDAFKEGEAVIGEYMIQNQTAAALVERASNLWAKAFVNPEGVDMVKEMAQAWYDLSKQMTQSDALMGSLHTSIELIAGAISILIKLFPVLIRFGIIFATTFGFKGLIAGVGGLVTAFRTLYKDIALATGAMGMFNVMMKSNAILFAISSLTTAVTLFIDYSKAADEAAKRERERQAKLKAAFDESKEAVENVVKPLERYKRILEEGNLSEKQKAEVIKELNNKYQEYLDYLGIEIKSAEDLAKAYAKVVDIMKIKKAYEERESFRQQKNGDNRMSRIENQAKVEAAARSFGLTDVDKQFLEKNQHLGTNELYRQLIEKKMGAKAVRQDNEDVTFTYIDDKLVDADTQFGPRAKKRYEKVGSEELYDAINEYILSFRSERNTNKEIDAMFDSEFTWTDKNGKKRKLSEFNMDEYNDTVQKAVYKRKGSLENEKPDKAAIAAAKKEAQERKKALKLEMDEAQKASTGIISKLEEYYRLQEAAINDARADGQLTEEQAKEMVRALSILKNESLATARRAVTTGETKDWDELKTKVLPAVMSDTSEVSRNLLSTIQQVAIEKLNANLEKFNGSSDVLGLDSRAFFDQMNAKAAGNTREAARLRAKIQNEVERALMQYQFVEKANQQMRKDLEAIGITTETYEQWAKRMQQGITEKPATQLGMRTEQREQMYRSFEAYGEQTKGPKDAEGQYSTADKDVVQWVQQWSQQADNAWMKGLPQLDEWLSDTDKYEKQIADFYRTLLSMYEGYKKQIQQSGNDGTDFFAFTQGQQQVSDATAQLDKMFGRSITDQEAYREMGNKFIQHGVINFRYNIENQQEAEQWLNDFATTSAGELEDWAQAFPELVEWIDLIKRKEQGETLGDAELQALQNAMPQIKNLYNEMLNHADRVNKAMKQAFDHEKQQQDIRFQVAGYRKQEEETDKSWESIGKQKESGINATFWEQQGLGSIVDDPEIQRIQNRIYWRNQELLDAQAQFEQRKALNEQELQALRDRNATEAEIEALRLQQKQDNAGIEELIKEKQTQFFNETSNLSAKVAQELQKRVQAINTLVKPVETAAKSIGQKLGDMIFNMESEEATWEQIWKNMALAVAESMLTMAGQYAQNAIIKASMNKAEETEEGAHATVMTMLGISEGAAKTIGTLGWIGIALIPVITSLLMGLLTSALSTKRDSNNSTSTSAAKTKTVSGMLTYKNGNVQEVTGGGARGAMGGRRMVYDDGNVQVWDRQRPRPVVGTDGRVYMVTDQDELRTGLVTQPIATTVNGRPAIVGETGPEVVIGRDTTAAIMRKEPELLNRIAEIDKQHSGAGQHAATGSPFRPLAKGNVGETISLSKSKRVEDVVKHYHVDTDSTESLTRWLRDFITVSKREDTKRSANETPVAASPTETTPADATTTVLRQWLADPEKHKQEIQTLYTTLRREEDSRQLHIKTEREQTTLLNEQRTSNERRQLEEQQTRETIEQVYHGSDGRNYMAKTMQLPEGVTAITQPIATMVNGQPGLVAERGPEIVIGRETTRRLMMNQPDLLRAIATVDAGHAARRLRTYDEGTGVPSVAMPSQSQQPADQQAKQDQNERIAEALDQNTQMMAAFVQMMNTIQQRGIPAHINKYGPGGLVNEVKSGLKFDSRYNR